MRVANPIARPAALAPAQVAAALEGFHTWAARYSAAPEAEKQAMVPAGLALVEARSASFGVLIQSDPKAAIEALLPYELRKAMPKEIAAKLEHRVSGTGNLMVRAVLPLPGQTVEEPISRVAQFADKTYRAYTYGKRLADISRSQTAILGVGVELVNGERLLAVRDEAYQVLEKSEAADIRAEQPAIAPVCPVSGDPTETKGDETAVDTGGEIVWLCKGGHLSQWLMTPDGQVIVAAGGGGSSGGTSPIIPATYTQGNKKFLAIRVRFSDQAAEPATDATMQTELQTVVDRFSTWSYGKLQATFAFAPTLMLPQTDTWYAANGADVKVLTDARILAAAYTDAGGARPYDTANFDFDAVVFKSDVIGDYCGATFVGYRGVFIKCVGASTFLHEWGHSFGLWHANAWIPSSSSPIGAGANEEYGSPFSVLGPLTGTRSYNTPQRYALHWLEPTDVTTISASGTYRLYNAEQTTLVSGRPYALRIPAAGGEYYFVEFRPNLSAFNPNFVIANGVMIARTNPGQLADELLDMNPLTAAGMDDSPLLIGRSFNDAGQDLTVTPITRSGTGLGDYMDVVVNFTFSATNSAPVATLTASNSQPAVGASITLTATASDPDSDTLAYAWDFGEGSVTASNVSANNSATQTKSWSVAGDYWVRCTVSDQRGKTVVQSKLITVGTSTATTISGQVTKSDGTGVADVLIKDTENHLTYTDSNGNYTLGLLAANSSYTLSALRYGWTVTAQFTNPVSIVTTSRTNINFTATETADSGGIMGLAGQYFNIAPARANFDTLESLQAHVSGLSPTLSTITSSLNFADTGSGFPAPYNAGTNNFESYYSGKLKLSVGGAYTFNTSSDDGSMLWIDGNVVVNNNFFQPVTTRSGLVTLTAGYHNIVVGFYQGSGGYGMNAQISGPGNTTMVDIKTAYASARITPDLVLGSLAGGTDISLTTGNLITGGNNTNTAFSGVISGIGDLNKWGSGTQTLTSANTYTGATTVTRGTLIIQNTLASPMVAIASGAVAEFNGGISQTASATFTGTGTLRKTGVGDLTWGSAVATFALGAGSLIDVQGGTFVGGSYSNEVWTSNLSSLNVAPGAIFNGIEANVRVDALTGAGTINSGYFGLGSVTFGANNGSGTFSGVLADSEGVGNFVKGGVGKQTLSGANTYTGGTTVNGGTLVIQNTLASPKVAIASGAVAEFNGGISQTASATFTGTGTLRKTGVGDLTWGSAVATFALGAGSLIDVQGGAFVGGSYGNEVWTSNLSGLNVAAGVSFRGVEANVRVDALTGAGTITSGYPGGGYLNFTFGVNNGSGTFGGVLANGTSTGSFVKTGSGSQTLTGANTFGGTFTINGGHVRFGNLSGNATQGSVEMAGTGSFLFLDAVNQFGSNAGINFNSVHNEVVLNGHDQTIAFLSSVGGVTAVVQNSHGSFGNASASSTLTVNQSTNTTYSGYLRDNTGNDRFTLSLVKSGLGTLTLAGSSITYTGTTTVNAGTLGVNGNSISDTGTLVINSGKVNLAGTETVSKLFYGATQQAVGTYGSTSSSATFKDNTRFSGSGILNVQKVTVTGYNAWLAGYTFAPGADSTAAGDADNDGANNLLEYVLNRNPSASDASVVPQLDASGSNFVFTFSRRTESVGDTTLVFQYGSTLRGWTEVSIVAGPQVTIGAPAGAVQLVTVTIPKAGQNLLLGRLKVTQP